MSALRQLLCPHCGSEIHFTKPIEAGSAVGICEKCLTVLHYVGPVWALELTDVGCPLGLLPAFHKLEQQAKALRRSRNGSRIIT